MSTNPLRDFALAMADEIEEAIRLSLEEPRVFVLMLLPAEGCSDPRAVHVGNMEAEDLRDFLHELVDNMDRLAMPDDAPMN